MPDPATYRPAPGSIPVEPGVYRFSDQHGRVIYVGKAKSLRSRLTSYFADIAGLHPRTRQMVTTAAKVEWTVVNTEVEALQLEYNWIKEFDPRFNVRYRDDKSYPVLAVTLNEEYPRLFVYRGPRRKGVRYFGPYSHAWAIRETVDLLTRVFPARTCSSGVFKRHSQIDRPCLLGYIDKCSAPCVGRVSADEHRKIVEDFCDFLSGKTDRYARELEHQMSAAAEQLDFERAARLRDDLSALRRALEKQAVVFGDGTDADVVAFAEDELEAAVQVFHVRGGRVRGQRGWIVEKPSGPTDPGDSVEAQLVEQFLTQFYGEQAELERRPPTSRRIRCRGRCWCRACRRTPTRSSDWLSGLRGSRVALRVPRRGDKKALAETVQRNAQEALQQHKLRRAGDFNARSAALQSIQDSLGLAAAPLRIECVDISHVQGTDVVASLVVFEDGLPRKSDYRHYAIKEAAGDGRSDDVASIAEVTRRRFWRHVRDTEHPEELAPEGRSRKFAYPPNLYVVDGGAPQVNAAAAVLDGTRGHRRRGDRVGEAPRGGVGARRTGPGHPPAQQRRAVPAAARPRRGAPLRHHLPPQQAVEADDGLGARRGARPRRAPAQGAGDALRVGGAAQTGVRRGDHLGARHRRDHRGGGAGGAGGGAPSPTRPPKRNQWDRPHRMAPVRDDEIAEQVSG